MFLFLLTFHDIKETAPLTLNSLPYGLHRDGFQLVPLCYGVLLQ